MTQPISPRRRTLPLVAALAVVALGGIATVSYVQAQGSATPPSAAGAAPAAATPVQPDKVVVTVNGQKITEADVATAQKDLSEEISGAGGDPRQAAIDSLINLALIAQAADKDKLADSPDFKARMALLRQRVLRSEFIRAKVTPGATDALMKKRYDEEVAKLDSPEEIKAAHILVPTEDEAKAIIADLDKGGDFAAIAKEKSKDPGSAANGGDLGYFAKGQMVKDFEDAAFALQVGQYTKTPVKSDFGYHVIKLEDKRKQPPPSYDEVKEQLQQIVMTELYRDMLADLRKNAKIDPPIAAAPPAPAPAK